MLMDPNKPNGSMPTNEQTNPAPDNLQVKAYPNEQILAPAGQAQYQQNAVNNTPKILPQQNDQQVASAPQTQPAPSFQRLTPQGEAGSVQEPILITTPTEIPPTQALTPVTPTQGATTAQVQNAPFDPSRVKAYASSTPINPITASYTPAPGTHIPDEVAAKINETPLQSSADILKQGKKGSSLARLRSAASIFIFIGAIIIAAFLINLTVFQSYYVDGSSMTPTLQNNDRLIISKVERTLSIIQSKTYIPERGQIVTLDSSITGLNGQKEQLIKRVIGLPGDRVQISNGVVTITNSDYPNGVNIDQELGLTNLDATYTDSPVDVIVPQGAVYVMGDNRKQGGSYDSRSFGAVSGDKIRGRLWARVLPLDQARLY